MSDVFYHAFYAFCGYSQNTVLTLCLLSRHLCMINAAKGCLCANHVLPLCFMKENTYLVPYFVYLMTFVRHLCRPHLMPPSVILYLFTPANYYAHRAKCVINPDLPPPRMPPKGQRPAVSAGAVLLRRLRSHNIQQHFARCPLIPAKRSPPPRQPEVLPTSTKQAFLKALYRVLPMQ